MSIGQFVRGCMTLCGPALPGESGGCAGAVARHRHVSPDFRSAVSDACYLPLEDGACMLSFSIGLIEHFDRTTAADIVCEMARVTEASGLVAVMVPWRSSFYNLVRQIAGARWPFGREHPFGRDELIRFMRGLGLRDVQIHIVYMSTLLATGRKPERQAI